MELWPRVGAQMARGRTHGWCRTVKNGCFFGFAVLRALPTQQERVARKPDKLDSVNRRADFDGFFARKSAIGPVWGYTKESKELAE